MRNGRVAGMALKTLETLTFDNAALRELPLDTVNENTPRQVRGACFSKVAPTPLGNPTTVVYSASAMRLIDLDEEQLHRDDFPGYLCGSKSIPGAEYAAHCYCGHQFGYFSGQLGDGATMYVGEVLNSANQRWEIQFKGAGKTPFSRTADGRKVLRSSLREFLCSEAMFNLGVPTTRAGSCIVSTDTVVRDILYDGHPINEKCTVILRIAPTFLRFGSFEIFKSIDGMTSRVGPSVGQTDILRQMLRYVKDSFYPDLPGQGDQEEGIVAMYREIMDRTARLVAHWQTVGFCHGVLNTDNMSILGLTIDYGPYGFMETFDPGFICNASDKGGRYSYEAQPAICKWNVKKLGEMLSLIVPEEALASVTDHWDQVYETAYNKLMRRKLGLLSESPEDGNLFTKLFETMQQTHSDFTNTFLLLQNSPFLDEYDVDRISERMAENCLSVDKVKRLLKPTFSKSQCLSLLRVIQGLEEGAFNPLSMYGIEVGTVLRDHETHQHLDQLETQTDEDRTQQCKDAWNEWIKLYKVRVDLDREDFTGTNYSAERLSIQKCTNPVVIPRNHVLQRAIDRAELGDYSTARRLLAALERPFEKPEQDWMCERDIGDKGACTVT